MTDLFRLPKYYASFSSFVVIYAIFYYFSLFLIMVSMFGNTFLRERTFLLRSDWNPIHQGCQTQHMSQAVLKGFCVRVRPQANDAKIFAQNPHLCFQWDAPLSSLGYASYLILWIIMALKYFESAFHFISSIEELKTGLTIESEVIYSRGWPNLHCLFIFPSCREV